MGVYRAINETATLIENNLAAKLTTVAGWHSVTLHTGFSLFKRSRAENNHRRDKATVSVWASSALTRAASQVRRRWKVELNVDYTFQGQDRDEVATQVELAVDALMLCVDLLPDAASTVSAASEEQFATVAITDLDDLLQDAAGDVTVSGPIMGGVRLTFPVIQHDTLV